MKKEGNIKIHCTTEELSQVRIFVEGFLNALQLNESDVNLLTLAVDEICANRIIHSHKTNDQNTMEVSVVQTDEGITFNIIDNGDFYDITKHPDPDIHHLIKIKRKGGVGLFLVKKIMDHIEVQNNAGNVVHTLFKKLKSPIIPSN